MLGNNQNEGTKFIGLKAKGKANENDPTPYFGLREKVGEDYEITKKFDFVEGVLEDIENYTYEWEGQQKEAVKMKMSDVDETYIIDASLNSGIMKNTLNSLLGSKDKLVNGRLKISVYPKKSKTNDKVYGSSWVTIDGEKTNWAYEPDAFPAVEKNKKGVVIDDSEYISFLQKMVTDISEHLKANADNKVPVESTTTNNSGGDDLPF